jgi:hypothetical protein
MGLALGKSASCGDCEGAGAPGIEITGKMILAGVGALCAPDSIYENDAETVARIFLKMICASGHHFV